MGALFFTKDVGWNAGAGVYKPKGFFKGIRHRCRFVDDCAVVHRRLFQHLCGPVSF